MTKRRETRLTRRGIAAWVALVLGLPCAAHANDCDRILAPGSHSKVLALCAEAGPTTPAGHAQYGHAIIYGVVGFDALQKSILFPERSALSGEKLRQMKLAMNHLFRSADAGFATGQYLYGLMLPMSSHGTRPKYELEAESQRWIRAAAEQGQIDAMYAFGIRGLAVDSFDLRRRSVVDPGRVAFLAIAANEGLARAREALEQASVESLEELAAMERPSAKPERARTRPEDPQPIRAETFSLERNALERSGAPAGRVLLRFALTREGMPSAIWVKKSEPQGVWDEIAITELTKGFVYPASFHEGAPDLELLEVEFFFGRDPTGD
ncbi:MAG: hypothetical protein NXI30_02580 [bacterium]|nr:hypothetical protein [bacterium]